MCELSVYKLNGETRELVMESVVRLVASDGKVLMESILGESAEVKGRLVEVDITSAQALVVSS